MKSPLTVDILVQCGAILPNCAKYVSPLNKYFPIYHINTLDRGAQCLGQLLHESAGMRTAREYASGEAYEGRHDLGNDFPGDGMRYKGRGLIQITGRSNYTELSQAVGINYIENPTWLERPDDAVLASMWYWSSRDLNALASKKKAIAITRAINGGTNGLKDRLRYIELCYVALRLCF